MTYRRLTGRHYGLTGPTLVLIRPGGYIAFRGPTDQELRTYLADAVGVACAP